VDQEFGALVRSQRNSMPLPMNLLYFGTARRQNPAINGIDCQAVARHSLRENRIRNILKGYDRTGKGRIKNFHLHYDFEFCFLVSPSSDSLKA
jgi:hypothetical protein